MIDLTTTELFKDILVVSLNGSLIDLHNDYECELIKIDNLLKTFAMKFRLIGSHNESDKIVLLFENIILTKEELYFKKTEGAGTLDLFYKGKYEVDGKLYEKSETNQFYFYLDFVNGNKYELFSSRVILAKANEIGIL